MSKTFSRTAIVIKRVDVGEYDRIVTLITAEEGKLVVVAKGVRKIGSSKAALLEPGNLVHAFLVKTQSLPILTQAQLQADFGQAKTSLKKLKQLTQVLEIADRLLVEDAEDEIVFEMFKMMLEELSQVQPQFNKIQTLLSELLIHLGYQPLEETKYQSISEYVTSVADRPLKSYDYLTVKGK
jgi:DNA repair protein RecO (recombination protein O)